MSVSVKHDYDKVYDEVSIKSDDDLELVSIIVSRTGKASFQQVQIDLYCHLEINNQIQADGESSFVLTYAHNHCDEDAVAWVDVKVAKKTTGNLFLYPQRDGEMIFSCSGKIEVQFASLFNGSS